MQAFTFLFKIIGSLEGLGKFIFAAMLHCKLLAITVVVLAVQSYGFNPVFYPVAVSKQIHTLEQQQEPKPLLKKVSKLRVSLNYQSYPCQTC